MYLINLEIITLKHGNMQMQNPIWEWQLLSILIVCLHIDF